MLRRQVFFLLSLVLCVYLVSATWAQQKQDGRLMGFQGNRDVFIRRILDMIPKSSPSTLNQGPRVQATTASTVTAYDIGTYPGGTWFTATDISESGVVVGVGDNSAGETRAIGLPLIGPNAWEWFDIGPGYSHEPFDKPGGCSAISDSGMIVGFADNAQGYPRAFVWTPRLTPKRVDLEPLPNDTCSEAYGVNRLGTIIVGFSHTDEGMMSAVAWTPKVVWNEGKATTVWKINKLDTAGWEQPDQVIPGVTLRYWYGMAANDLGQITGRAVGVDTTNQWYAIPLIWNPVPSGKGWTVKQLPISTEYQSYDVWDMNNKGEVVGTAYPPLPTGGGLPALWKPDQLSRKTYTLIVLPALMQEPTYTAAWGINELGDIVGGGFNSFPEYGFWKYVAARWSTYNPSFVEMLGFPNALDNQSNAVKVNNKRIAVGGYSSVLWGPLDLGFAVKFK